MLRTVLIRAPLVLGAIATILELIVATSAAAQEQKDCYSIATPATSSGGQGISLSAFTNAAGTILLNRCTGQTWILGRTYLSDKTNAYRWFPLSAANGEFEFGR